MLVVASAPPYMSPSPRSGDFVRTLQNAGLGVPSSDLENEQKYLDAAKPFSRRAKDLFKGAFRNVLKSVQAARSLGIQVDLYIISPRYGLVSEEDRLLPYAFSLTSKPITYLRSASEKLKINEKLGSILSTQYDVCAIVANRNDVVMMQAPQSGFDLANLCKELVVFSAPSTSAFFRTGVKVIGALAIGKRTSKFAKYIDEITSKPLSDYTNAAAKKQPK